jgi:hypothetical protein
LLIAARLRRLGTCLAVQSQNLWADLRSPSFRITLQISQFAYLANLLVLLLFIIGPDPNALTRDNGLVDLLFLLDKGILDSARIDLTPRNIRRAC